MLEAVPEDGGHICRTVPDRRTLGCAFTYILCTGRTLGVTMSPHVKGQSFSHLYFLQNLKAFNFPNAIVIQIHVLKHEI